MLTHGACKGFALFDTGLHITNGCSKLGVFGLLTKHGENIGDGNACTQNGTELTAENRHILCCGVAEEGELNVLVQCIQLFDFKNGVAGSTQGIFCVLKRGCIQIRLYGFACLVNCFITV